MRMQESSKRPVVLCLLACVYLILIGPSFVFGQWTLELPNSLETQQVAVNLPAEGPWTVGCEWHLVDKNHPDLRVATQVVRAVGVDGKLADARYQLLATLPPGDRTETTRAFQLKKNVGNNGQQRSSSARDATSRAFEFRDKENSRRLVELFATPQGAKPVLEYKFGTVVDQSVPANDGRRSRACYIHPVWGMNGEILTDDFPEDHYHHHGVFWTWPFVQVGDKTYDLWVSTDIRQRFVKWLSTETGPVAGVLGVENGWFVDDRQVATERVWIRAYKSEAECRAIDVTLIVEAMDQPVTLQGREGKSYGGFTVRFDVWPRTDALVRVPDRALGNVDGQADSEQDLLNTPLPWADLTSMFPTATGRSGAALLIHPSHPDYPPTWLTRTYGALCVGWPGIRPHTLAPGESVKLEYRIWVHRTELNPEQIDHRYQSYCDSTKSRVEKVPDK